MKDRKDILIFQFENSAVRILTLQNNVILHGHLLAHIHKETDMKQL